MGTNSIEKMSYKYHLHHRVFYCTHFAYSKEFTYKTVTCYYYYSSLLEMWLSLLEEIHMVQEVYPQISHMLIDHRS